jgi:hypothetical protein
LNRYPRAALETSAIVNFDCYPRTVTRCCAAILAGVSRQYFNEHFIAAGLVALEDGRVVLHSLAAALARPIALTDIFDAQRSLEPSRYEARQRQRQKRRA